VRRGVVYYFPDSTSVYRAGVVELVIVYPSLCLINVLPQLGRPYVFGYEAPLCVHVPHECPDLVGLNLDVLGSHVVLICDGNLFQILQLQHPDAVVAYLFYRGYDKSLSLVVVLSHLLVVPELLNPIPEYCLQLVISYVGRVEVPGTGQVKVRARQLEAASKVQLLLNCLLSGQLWLPKYLYTD
jgi:hypothetical protein